MKNDATPSEAIGELADMIDSLNSALSIPMPDSFHVKALRASLPAVISLAREIYVEMTGNDPWSDIE